MLKLLKHLKKYRIFAFFGPFLKLLEALMETFVPFIMSDIIDNGIKNNDSRLIISRGLLLVGIAVLGWIFAISAQFFSAKAAMGFGLNLRTALFDRILGMDMEEIDRISIPSLITRTTVDVNRAQTGLNMFLRLILRNPFIIIGAIVMSGIINVRVMIIYIIIVPVVSLAFYLTIRFAKPFYGRIQSLIDSISTFCRENIIGIRSVRAFGIQKKEQEDFEKKTAELLGDQMRASRLTALNNPISIVVLNVSVAAVLLVGARFVNSGLILSGSIIALVNYLFQILLSIERTASLVEAFNKANVSSKRIADILCGDAHGTDGHGTGGHGTGGAATKDFEAAAKDLEAAAKDPDGVQRADAGISELPPLPSPGEELIRFDRVSFSYEKNGRSVLSDISFSVRRGSSLGIIGGTGSGKSTLVKLIQGIYLPTEGTVTVAGKDISGCSPEALRKLFSVAMQKAFLFKGSVRENILLGNPAATDEDVARAADASVSTEFISKKPGGMDHIIEYGGKNISGGQKQRLTLARAFIRQAPVLVLDDATSALDYVTEAAIRKYILSGETLSDTKIIVSQRISAVAGCDSIVVLEDGAVKGIGSHRELLESCPVYNEIYLSQTGDLSED
ncbi:MAG: ABC transporter ATP-binding protein [Clostridia bacterium]|nr:ABC transporter ATP-binding protein [Clostridia bacterium]